MNVCDQCPLRLFNNRGHNINGIGNIWSGSALVLPNVDIPAYKKQDMSFSSQVGIINTIYILFLLLDVMNILILR